MENLQPEENFYVKEYAEKQKIKVNKNNDIEDKLFFVIESFLKNDYSMRIYIEEDECIGIRDIIIKICWEIDFIEIIDYKYYNRIIEEIKKSLREKKFSVSNSILDRIIEGELIYQFRTSRYPIE